MFSLHRKGIGLLLQVIYEPAQNWKKGWVRSAKMQKQEKILEVDISTVLLM